MWRPIRMPAALAAAPIVVKLYRRPLSADAADLLSAMIAWGQALSVDQRAQLHRLTAWPLALVSAAGRPAGIAMFDVSGRFQVPFLMPSGRREPVLLSLEHLLGSDDYLQLRGLGVRLDTTTRAALAERVSGALAFLHRHGIVASDVSPNNLLIGFNAGPPSVCLIDCDSMAFRGRQALAQVETADWQMPAAYSEPPLTRAADAYKLGLVVLRLFARSHDARQLAPYVRLLPAELRPLLECSLAATAANRPPAGEWQRALRRALADGGLNERYPGPAPKPIAPARAAVPRPAPRERPSGAAIRPTVPPIRGSASPIRASARPIRGSARQPSGRHPFELAWLLVAAVVFFLVLSRLFAASVSTRGSPNTPSGAASNDAPQYYVPIGPGTGGDFH